MKNTKERKLKVVRNESGVPGKIAQVLAELHKATRAIAFYPESHPLREEILATTYQIVKEQVKEKDLVLLVSRAGIALKDSPVKIEANQVTAALAGELFMRRIKNLVFLSDLSLDDLRSFLQLLALDAKKLVASGGMPKEMLAGGIKTIWANEIDLAAIKDKRQAMDQPEPVPAQADQDQSANSKAYDGSGPASKISESGEGDSLMELLARMDRESDDGRYQQFARNLAAKAESSKERGVFAPLLLVLLGLVQQHNDLARSQVQRDYAVLTLGQLAEGAMTDFILQYLETKSPKEAAKFYPVLSKLGVKIAYVIIQRLCLANELHVRKALAAALHAIGPPAIPALVAMLKDERWYVVRNMVAILGQIGSRENVHALQPALYHGDQRVRKETIHALVKTGGSDAEAMVIDLLNDPDPAIVLYSIMALGLLKSKAALPLLIQMVAKQDFFSRRVQQRKEAILSLGRIGDKQATSTLLKVLDADSWLPWNKWDDLKISAANALGRIEDESALPILKVHAARGGSLAKACSDAIDNIERVAKGIYD